MVRLSSILRKFRTHLRKLERVRWYCYTEGAGADVLLIKDKTTNARYLFKSWETALSVGPTRISKAISRYSRFKRQNVTRFGFLGHRLRLSAFALGRSEKHRNDLALYNFESHSDRVLYSHDSRDPLFSLFDQFLREEGYVTEPSISKKIKGARFAKVYVDSDVLMSYLMGVGPALQFFSRTAKARIQLVTSTLVIQDLMLISKKTRRPTPSQIQHLLAEKRLTVIDTARVSEVAQYLGRSSPEFRELHPNDIVSLLSASQIGCTFFITEDKELLTHRETLGLRIVTPRALLHQLES